MNISRSKIALAFKLPLVAVLALLLTASPAAAAEAAAVDSVAKELICQCGCNMVLANCNHVGCHGVETMTAEIVTRLDSGLTKAETIKAFVNQYGEQVLAAPIKKGFNLTAYVLPFAAILGGAGAIYAAVTMWVGRGAAVAGAAVAAAGRDVKPPEIDEKYRLRLQQELDQYTRGK